MNNPAEEIVSVWAQLCKKQFVMMNVPYQSKSESGKSITREIDLLTIDSPNHFIDYEVKWRTTSWVNATESETIDGISEQLNNDYRNSMIAEIAKKFVGTKMFQVKKILVTPRKHFGKYSLEQRVLELKGNDIEIEWFENVLSDLMLYIKDSPNKGQFDSTAIGAIRILQEIQDEPKFRQYQNNRMRG